MIEANKLALSTFPVTMGTALGLLAEGIPEAATRGREGGTHDPAALRKLVAA